MSDLLKYQIALTLIPGVGAISAKKLVGYCGGVEAIFKEKQNVLMKIPGVGEFMAKAVVEQDVLERAEQEVEFISRNNVKALFYLDENYPSRLRHCEDGPLLVYVRGHANLHADKVIAVVGTRSVTEYGKDKCTELVRGLAGHNALVVSGLAYGVDTCAHKTALDVGLQTVAVLGHGLDRIYPPPNKNLAREIENQGALVTDFVSGTKPDSQNFPMRNRIIAGLCDAIIVVEAGPTGGALITAEIAGSYNRDVFAVPGRTTDTFSRGCNKLIKIHKANLLESIADVEYIMGWSSTHDKNKSKQRQIFVELEPREEQIVEFLKQHQGSSLDYIVAGLGFTVSQTSALLLGLEFKGLVKPLPGKIFKLS